MTTNPANLHDLALADLRDIVHTLAPGAEAGHHRAVEMVRKLRQAIALMEDAERARVEEIAALRAQLPDEARERAKELER